MINIYAIWNEYEKYISMEWKIWSEKKKKETNDIK